MDSKIIPSFFLILSLFFTSSLAANFEIRNNCPYTVWAAAFPSGGQRLDNGQVWNLNANPGSTGRIWGRTKCNFDGNGRGSCETGDCAGLLQCQVSGKPPATLVEYTLNQNNLDFVDVSVIDGFNIPMDLSPTSGSCNKPTRCTATDINDQCPAPLKVPGGCNGPCTVFGTDQYCCNSGNCTPTDYSQFFKQKCPNAYSYPKDDPTSLASCPSTNYRVVFCP